MRQRRQVQHNKRRGFTLIEVLLVLAILGVIAAMVVPQLMGRQKKANIDATRLSITGVEQALDLYAVDHSGEYPTTAEGLEALISHPNNDEKWNGPYLKETKVPVDAWGRPLQYEFPGQHNAQGTKPDISSGGLDKAFGTEDDINNWTK
ncbi:MAG: type II secretion system major pseudopilin GspG [Planctomycetota bacterium]